MTLNAHCNYAEITYADCCNSAHHAECRGALFIYFIILVLGILINLTFRQHKT
jgi:hypothetical protein